PPRLRRLDWLGPVEARQRSARTRREVERAVEVDWPGVVFMDQPQGLRLALCCWRNPARFARAPARAFEPEPGERDLGLRGRVARNEQVEVRGRARGGIGEIAGPRVTALEHHDRDAAPEELGKLRLGA